MLSIVFCTKIVFPRSLPLSLSIISSNYNWSCGSCLNYMMDPKSYWGKSFHPAKNEIPIHWFIKYLLFQEMIIKWCSINVPKLSIWNLSTQHKSKSTLYKGLDWIWQKLELFNWHQLLIIGKWAITHLQETKSKIYSNIPEGKIKIFLR